MFEKEWVRQVFFAVQAVSRLGSRVRLPPAHPLDLVLKNKATPVLHSGTRAHPQAEPRPANG